MISSNLPENNPNEFSIKKELSNAFIRIGLITVSIGLASVWLGLWLNNQVKAGPLLTILPLLIGLPIVLLINLVIIRRTLVKINSQSRK